MSLANRFSALLLATLGLTLVGFSTALFVSSWIYLNRQVDDRLAASLTLLRTCVDRKPDWVRWEPREKRLPPSRWNERGGTAWLVSDGQGRLLKGPAHLRGERLAALWAAQMGHGTLPERLTDHRGRQWRVAQLRFSKDSGPKPAVGRPPDTPEKTYHDEVVLAGFASLDETEAALATLGCFLAGITVTVWILAALCTRWLTMKTLVPLTRLVESARSLDAANPGWTLAEVGTRDELDHLRRAFNDLLARLHEAYERQRRFSSEASHQLRTPVAVLIGHLEVAQRYERSSEQYLRVIQLAHRRASDLARIVESLMFLNQPDTSTLTQLEPLELSVWLVEHLAGRTESPRSSDVVVASAVSGSLWIKAQPQLLAQVVENLLDNACKYSQPATPIKVATAREGDGAFLSVEDSGCGIARDELPRIFEPFFRTSHTLRERIAGHGLGLSVVERIVTAFGGTITAESHVGRGSRFEVRLPLASAPDLSQ